MVVAAAGGDDEVRREVGLGIELGAIAFGLLRIDQLRDFGAAAYRGELLVVHVVLVDVGVEAQLAVGGERLHAELVRGDGFGLGRGDGVGEREATLHAGRAEAVGHAHVGIGLVADGVTAGDVAAPAG